MSDPVTTGVRVSGLMQQLNAEVIKAGLPMGEESLIFRLGQQVEKEEDYKCEFKAITGHNPFNRIRKDVSEYITAFLNSQGGAIYFGIENDGTVSGLLMDRQDRDKTLTFIDQKVHEIDPPIDPSLVNVQLFLIYDKEQQRDDLCVLKVSVKPGSEPVYYERRGGKAWVRQSGSNYCLKASQIKERLARHRRQRIEEVDEEPGEKVRSRWRVYLERLLRDFDDKKWEEEIYLSLSCEPLKEGSSGLWQNIKRFLDDESDSVLFVNGRPGAGKTVLMKRWVYRLAEDALTNLKASDALRPELQVPLYVNLNGYVHDSSFPFTNYVAQKSLLGQYLFDDPLLKQGQPREVFREPIVPFVVFLDALDEMDSSSRTIWLRNLSDVEKFLDNLARPRLKVIVTCRPDVMPRTWSYPSKGIAPLSRQAIEDYFIAHLKEESAREAIDFIFGETKVPRLLKQLRELLQVPLLLEAAAKYWKEPVSPINAPWDEEEIVWEPSLGRLVAHIFDAAFMWERDKSLTRGWEFNAQDWKDKLGQVAYWMDGKISQVGQAKVLELFGEARKQDKQSKHKQDLICLRNMGILHSHPSGVSFFNGLTQLYFAAWKLKGVMEENVGEFPSTSELKRYRSFWKLCIDILQDITYRDVGTLLQQVAVEHSDQN